jgi:hypothetical protein
MPKTQHSLMFSMHEDQLCISREGRCSHRIRLWPRPLAQEWNSGSGRWERFFPHFRIVSYPLPKPKPKAENLNQLELALDVAEAYLPGRMPKKKAYDLLRQTLPPSYGIALAPFKGHQWSMIGYLWKNRRFYELLKGNPVLAFTLANDRELSWAIYMKDLTLEKITGMKQTRLLEILDLPGSKKVVQMFRKIHPASAQLNLLKQIRYCLRDESSGKNLSHLKRINAGVLHLLASADPVRSNVTPRLLEEVSQNRRNDHYPFAAHAMRECVQWHGQLRAGRHFPRLRTMEALSSYHAELATQIEDLLELQRMQQEEERARQIEHARREQADQARALEEAMKKPFPRPPVRGTASIIPLRTWGELVRESEQQHNCVRHYGQRVHQGGCYIYRITKPERASLSIVKSSASQWVIGELKTACNRAAGRTTHRYVERWLSSHQLGI